MLARLRQQPYKKWFTRVRSDRSIREAFFVFILTRTLIFLILICVGELSVFTYPDGGKDANIPFERPQIARKLRQIMGRGDAAHYAGLSDQGYRRGPLDITNHHSQQFAFFPLQPLLLRLLRYVTNDVIIWGAVLSNLFFFLALVLLHRLTLAFDYDEPVARRTLFYLAAFPVSYFFSVPMTESIFLFLTVASFYAAKRERWWAAGVFGLFASATRITGVLLLPSLLLLSWQMYRSLHVRKILGLLLIPFGLAAYSFYCWRMTGDALAFTHASAAWGRKPSIFFLGPLITWLLNPHPIAHAWNIDLLHAATAFLGFFCIYVLVRRREWALTLYTSLSIFVPLSSGPLQSLERYTMGFFPVFIALAIAAKSERSDQSIRFVFVFLLGVMTLLYAANFTNALS